MFGIRRKQVTQQTIDAIRQPLATLQNFQGLPPHFWQDEFVLGFFGTMIGVYSETASGGRLSQTDKGFLLSDAFTALSNMNGQAIARQFAELAMQSPQNKDFKHGADNGYICTLALFGKRTEEGRAAIADAKRMAEDQGKAGDRDAIVSNLLLSLFLEAINVRFAESERHPKAELAIKYRSDIKRDLEEIQRLGQKYTEMYISNLNDAPDQDAARLRKQVIGTYERDRRPFDDEELNSYYEELQQYGEAAQNKFREIRGVLGAAFDPSDVAKAVKREFEPQAVERFPSGLYEADGGIKFRIYPNKSVALVSKGGKMTFIQFPNISDFWEAWGGKLELENIRKAD